MVQLTDGRLDYFAHKFGLGLSTTRSLLLSALGTALTDMISPVYRGTQREDSSKPLKHSIVKRILVFKR